LPVARIWAICELMTPFARLLGLFLSACGAVSYRMPFLPVARSAAFRWLAALNTKHPTPAKESP
jgi:hypothetical protein